MSEKTVGRPPEEWRTIELDPTVEVSSRGRVRRRRKLSNIKYRDKDGYVHITIKGKTYSLHRIIAQTFIPNPDNLPVVDHINNIHDDNRVENLRWTTVQENSQYAAEMGLQSRLKNNKSVTILIDKDNKGYMFNTVADLCRKFNLNDTRVSSMLSGKAKSVNGYRAIRLDELFDERKSYE